MPDFPQFHPAPPPDTEVLIPAQFIRYKRQLRAVLLDEEPWFAASDLARLKWTSNEAIIGPFNASASVDIYYK